MKDVPNSCVSGINCDERDPERTPMQWDDSVSAGFSTNSTPWRLVSPDYKNHNVNRERGIAKSHLNIFKKMKELRKLPVFQDGDFHINPKSNTLTIVRSLDNDIYMLLINVAASMEFLEFDGINVECILTNEFSHIPIG